MLTANPRFILYLRARQADLWHRRGRSLHLCGSLDAAAPDFARQLASLLQRRKVLRLGLLLNLPDLAISSEPTPQAGYFDRRKIIARRLDYLHPRAALTGYSFGTDGSTRLYALRPHPALTAAFSAFTKSDTGAAWIAHAGLAALQWLDSRGTATGFCCLRLGRDGLLIAHAGRQALAVRPLAAERLNPSDLSQELEATYHYLQRHGWKPEDKLDLRLIGVPQPAAGQLNLHTRRAEPQLDGYAALLAFVAHHRPLQRLSRRRIRLRGLLLQLESALRWASVAALLIAVMSGVATMALTRSLRHEADRLQQAAADLPAAFTSNDETLYRQLAELNEAARTVHPAISATAPPPSRLVFTSGTDTEPTLQWDGEAPPALPHWRRDNATPSLSGTIGMPTPQDQSHRFSYEGGR